MSDYEYETVEGGFPAVPVTSDLGADHQGLYQALAESVKLATLTFSLHVHFGLFRIVVGALINKEIVTHFAVAAR